MSNRKIAHQPGYELKENPDTGARRWHAVMKKRPNPATGELVEEPALFEEVPDATEGDAAVEWLKARGVALYPGGSFDLPDPEDFANIIASGGSERALARLMKGFEKKGVFDDDPPLAVIEWLGELSEAVDSSGGLEEGVLDKSSAMNILDSALQGLYAAEGGSGYSAFAPAVALAAYSLDVPTVVDWVADKWSNGELYGDSLPEAIQGVQRHLARAAGYGKATGDLAEGLEEWLDEKLNGESNLVDDSSYYERASIMGEQRVQVLPSVVKLAGLVGEDDPMKKLVDDEEAFESFIHELPDEALSDFSFLGYGRFVTPVYEIRDAYHNWDEADRRTFREKFAHFIKESHERPAIAVNRKPWEASGILGEGGYRWRDVSGTDDPRFEQEAEAGLGRVVYGAYAHEGAVPYATDHFASIGDAIKRDPSVVNLGTSGWGHTRLLWVPEELTDGGTSFSFDDIGLGDYDYDDEVMNFKNSALLAALSHAARSTAEPTSRSLHAYTPAFTEVHLNRPLDVEGDLKAIYTPLMNDGEFPQRQFDRGGVEAIKEVVRRVKDYRSDIDLEEAALMAKRAPSGVPVNLVAPWLDSKYMADFDPTGQATQDLIGGIDDILKRDWGDKIKLWVPEGLRKE